LKAEPPAHIWRIKPAGHGAVRVVAAGGLPYGLKIEIEAVALAPAD
jgi:hypothetical protein